jgi:hypothetical protein
MRSDGAREGSRADVRASSVKPAERRISAVERTDPLERGNTYALVRPDGIVHLMLETKGDSVSGKAIAYGSPRMTSPATNPPFLTFRGALSR